MVTDYISCNYEQAGSASKLHSSAQHSQLSTHGTDDISRNWTVSIINSLKDCRWFGWSVIWYNVWALHLQVTGSLVGQVNSSWTSLSPGSHLVIPIQSGCWAHAHGPEATQQCQHTALQGSKSSVTWLHEQQRNWVNPSQETTAQWSSYVRPCGGEGGSCGNTSMGLGRFWFSSVFPGFQATKLTLGTGTTAKSFVPVRLLERNRRKQHGVCCYSSG